MIPIGFGHISGAGKDTAIRFLTTYIRSNVRGLSIKKRGFSSWQKEMAHQTYEWAGLKDEAYYDENRDERYAPLPLLADEQNLLGKTPVQIHIEFGKMLRAIHVKTLSKKLLTANHGCDILMINDLRDPVEADVIHEHGGYVFRINNPNVKPLSSIDEMMLDYSNWDRDIDNSGTLNQLNAQMVCLYKDFLEARCQDSSTA